MPFSNLFLLHYDEREKGGEPLYITVPGFGLFHYFYRNYCFMKKIFFISVIVALFLPEQQTIAQDSAAMMQAWQNFMTPGEHHKRLAKEAGTWEVDMSSWMAPDQPPIKSKGKYTVTMLMNGLYQQGSFSGNVMGMPFMGQSLTGYDNAKKAYVLTWIDNFGSGIIYMTGSYNEKDKTMSFNGTQTDPMTGNNTSIREEIKYHNNDHFTIAMFGPGMDGKEMKVMEAEYKRKKQ